MLIGSSMSCINEMYITGKNGNIFACQSHPEFDYEYCIKERIWPAVVDLKKRLNDEEVKVASASFSTHTAEDSVAVLELIKAFLHLPCPHCVACTSKNTGK
jgi:hypothetical protein